MSGIQVKMVLIPKREEFSDAERARLWWSREDYARFRQVLIDWKRANMHRISHTDNILSINFEHIDDDDIRQHEEAVAAADAVAAAAAAAADAIAAAAAAPATAPALSKVPPEAQQATADTTTPVVAAAAAAAATAAEVAIAEKEDRVERYGALESKKEAAKGEASTNGGYAQSPSRGHGDISDDENPAAQKRIGQRPSRLSHTTNVGRGRFSPGRSLRRAQTFVRNTPSIDGRLKAVPLSDLQATTQSLREWRKMLDQRRPAASIPNASGMDSRDRAVSLQQQQQPYKRRGRATPSLTRTVGENIQDAQDRSNLDGTGDGKEDPEEIKEEKHQRALSDPVGPMFSNPVMVAFQRQQREAAALQAGLEEKEQARAAATVEAAVAEAAAKRTAAEKVIENEEKHVEQAETIDGEETTEAQIFEGGSRFGWVEGEAPAGGKEPVVQMGLNDAPGSTAAAAVVGIRMAKDGVSPLSLRARDSVENLQNFAEEPSAAKPVPLSA